jgi:hypothetical protein
MKSKLSVALAAALGGRPFSEHGMKAAMQPADDRLLYFVATGLAAVVLAILIQAAHADDLDGYYYPADTDRSWLGNYYRALRSMEQAQDPQRMAKAQELQRYEPGHVFELDDADKRALSLYSARFGNVQMPPEKYDFPYDDPLFIQGGYDPDELNQVCPGTGEVPGIIGCADSKYRYTEGRTGCLIRLAREDVIISGGLTLNLVIRHEIGHCNGWRHPGMR